MKNIICCLLFFVLPLFAQNIVQVEKPEISPEYTQLIKIIDSDDDLNPDESIQYLLAYLSKTDQPYEQHQLIFWELAFRFAEMNQHEKCFEILKQGQNDGLFYHIRTGEHKWPKFIEQLESMDGFQPFLQQNDALREHAQKDAKFEYIVQLPDDYSTDKDWPLLIVLHGGVGTHIGLTQNWQSPKLQKEYIIAFMQGLNYRGSFARSFERDNFSNIISAFQQIAGNYPIDTTKVVLSGASAGGMRSVILTIEGTIPATGMILAFPVKPGGLMQKGLDVIARSGVRAVFLCGEKDWAIKQQKEMGYLFDQSNIPNRFVVFSGIGHEYPENFSEELDLSLKYIFRQE